MKTGVMAAENSALYHKDKCFNLYMFQSSYVQFKYYFQVLLFYWFGTNKHCLGERKLNNKKIMFCRFRKLAN